MSITIKWGILGTGVVACRFAEDLLGVPDAKLVAVASRGEARARAFGAEFGLETVHATIEDLVADDRIQIVYIATPHSTHNKLARLCLEAGKAVLCEKPFTVNVREAREVIELARSRSLFCMEAMWMRFMPLYGRLKTAIEQSAIGEVVGLTAHMGFAHEPAAEHRLFDRTQGGGSLLDLGVYSLSLASMLLGPHQSIQGVAALGPTGVDTHASMMLSYQNGASALLGSSLDSASPNEALILGTRGLIRIHAPFYRPHRMTITPVRANRPTSSEPRVSGLVGSLKRSALARRYDGLIMPLVRFKNRERTITVPFAGHGYQFEAIEAMRCLRAGLTESPVMPLTETLSMMESMDELRRQWKLNYPADSVDIPQT